MDETVGGRKKGETHPRVFDSPPNGRVGDQVNVHAGDHHRAAQRSAG